MSSFSKFCLSMKMKRTAKVEARQKIWNMRDVLEKDDDDANFMEGYDEMTEKQQKMYNLSKRLISKLKKITKFQYTITSDSNCFKSPSVSLRSHQKELTQKLVSQKGVIAVHGVGTGKTLAAISCISCMIDNLPDVEQAYVLTPAGLKSNFENALFHFLGGRKLDTINLSREFLKNSSFNKQKGDEIKLTFSNELIPHVCNNKVVRKLAPGMKCGICKKHILSDLELVNNKCIYQFPSVSQKKKFESVEIQSFDYFLLQFDKNIETLESFMNTKMLVVDEIHNLSGEIIENKNHHKKAKLVIQASKYAKRVLGLTGTLVINSPFDAANPATIARGDGKYLSEYQFKMLLSDSSAFKSFFGSLFSFYDSKHSPLYYPKIREINENIVMSKQEQAEYEMIEAGCDIESAVNTKSSDAFHTKMRQTVNNVGAKKVERIISILNSTKNKRSIICSQFLKHGTDLITKALKKANITFSVITGNLSEKEKDKQKQLFDEHKSEVMILSSAGFEGLSFKKVEHLFIFEPQWNQSTKDQIIGRAVRFGSHLELPPSRQLVTVYNLKLIKNKKDGKLKFAPVTGNLHPDLTVDELIEEISEEKEIQNKEFLKRLKSI